MADLLPIIMFSAATTITPGPNNFMILNSGLHFGVKKSLPHYLGICFGFPLMVLLVALGLGAIFLQYSWLKDALKIVGSAYMLYLAWCIISTTTSPKEAGLAKPFSFLQALAFQWVNPKAWLMAIGAVSIFSIAESHFHNALAISAIFLLVCIPCIGIWMVCGAFLKRILKNERQQKWFNALMAFCLVASIGMIIID
jgi:threonine/homoserine/homoserine lactone efflux protein